MPVRSHRWRAILAQTGRDLMAANVLELATALAFYAVLSLFPLLLAGAVLAATVVDPSWATDRVTKLLGEFLPRGEVEVEAIVQAAVAERGRVGVVSIAILPLTGRRVLGAVIKGLNIVSDVDEQADPPTRRALAELALLAGLTGVAVIALLSGPVLELARDAVDAAPGSTGPVVSVVTGCLRAGLLVLTFFLLYSTIPRGRRHGRASLIGAVAATALFLVVGAVFGVILDRVWPSMELVYGPLAVATLLLVWCWYAALITLTGAALASHVKTMLLEGHGAAEAERRHAGPAGADGRACDPKTNANASAAAR